MNTAERIFCVIPKFHHITDLLMNLQWLSVHQRILLEVLVLIYNLSGIFSILYLFILFYSRYLRSNNKLLINSDNP